MLLNRENISKIHVLPYDNDLIFDFSSNDYVDEGVDYSWLKKDKEVLKLEEELNILATNLDCTNFENLKNELLKNELSMLIIEHYDHYSSYTDCFNMLSHDAEKVRKLLKNGYSLLYAEEFNLNSIEKGFEYSYRYEVSHRIYESDGSINPYFLIFRDKIEKRNIKINKSQNIILVNYEESDLDLKVFRIFEYDMNLLLMHYFNCIPLEYGSLNSEFFMDLILPYLKLKYKIDSCEIIEKNFLFRINDFSYSVPLDSKLYLIFDEEHPRKFLITNDENKKEYCNSNLYFYYPRTLNYEYCSWRGEQLVSFKKIKESMTNNDLLITEEVDQDIFRYVIIKDFSEKFLV